jgi:6-phosphogluconolactonase
MKFWNLGRVTLALAASLVLIGGMDSCIYDYTNAYIIVTGSQYNQIASYREDNDTGQLRAAPGDPLSSGGQDPIRAVLLTGGRYVYVLNHGKPTFDSTTGNVTWTGGNISVFSIGGDGQLAYQLSYPSQGNGSVRLAMSGLGDFLYVLDSYEPMPGNPGVTPGQATKSAAYPCYDASTGMYRPVGDVTVFSIDPATGRLYLVQNQEQQTSTGVDLSYFPIGCGPIDMYQGSGYLFIAETSNPFYKNQNGEDIYPYQAPSGGQLLQPQSPQVLQGTTGISVINGSSSGKYIYILDNGTNTIYTFTAGANGFLSTISGGSYPNYSVTSGMTALTTDSTGSYLYIANSQAPVLGQPNSIISAFYVTPNTGDLQPITSGTNSMFPTGSGPVCIFEDTSHQYIYTADSQSSQVTGSHFDPNSGVLSNLSHGSAFPTVGTPTWCLYSANTN